MASCSLKRAKCAVCGQTADPREMVGVKRKTYHKACFKCFHEGCNDISPTNFAEIDDILYCNRHFDEIINRHLFCAEDGECFICHQPVYLPEKLMVSGLSYHRACFKCCYGCPLSQSDHEMFQGALYCSEHKKDLPDEYDGEYTKVYNLPELIKKGICTVLERPPRGRSGDDGGGGGGASSSGPEA